jgi:hypothetical protein
MDEHNVPAGNTGQWSTAFMAIVASVAMKNL